MTPAQLTTLKAAILANTAIAAERTANNHIGIAAHYNAPGTGVVWRPVITAAELNAAVVWTEYATLTAVLQNCFQAMIAGEWVDGTNTNIRAGFASIFAGTGAAVTRANLVALAQRVPTRFEMAFMTGSVCSLFGRIVTPNDVALAMGTV